MSADADRLQIVRAVAAGEFTLRRSLTDRDCTEGIAGVRAARRLLRNGPAVFAVEPEATS